MRNLIRTAAIAVGVLTVILGVWAMVDPRSFYEELAYFPPYNVHLFHDVGAFQIGLGASLILAVLVPDVLLAVLTGVGAGFVLHAVSHVVDRDLGGRPSDPYLIGLLALIVVAAAIAQWRIGARRKT